MQPPRSDFSFPAATQATGHHWAAWLPGCLGSTLARHVLTTLLISVAVAGILIYPFPFLYTTDYTIAAPNLPLHVWTDAQPLGIGGDKHVVEPDVIMRTIWVHGSYMEALNREVLLGALELQDEILGPTTNYNPRQPTNSIELLDQHADLSRKERDTFHVINGLTNQSWFFHSPLLYWACDAETIERDSSLLKTVNEKKTQPTSVNITLRHSIVFSGKSFEDRRLIAADALVVTLLHRPDSPVGRQWERKLERLVARRTDKWDVFPPNGVSAGSQLYEFQFRPISMQDAIVLSLAYSLTITYFLLSLSKIRAVKSKLGLIVTVVVQIAMSIISSLTVCAVLRIDLSRIPRAAYPLVLTAMSLENIFRLINSVILTPSDHSTSSRIGYAFGETGHVALASVVQNFLILWGLSKVVSSGVSAFCTFAAIAILFDFFYLSTFFLSVLSVDVRRTELSDALDKASFQNKRWSSENRPRQSLVDAVLQGRIALSTRIAGTIVMLGFVVVAQWHFFETAMTWSPAGFFRLLWKSSHPEASPSPYAEIHQARNPKSWLRLQDHETAKEVINVIKPWAHSYVARVYEPVVFVLKGANRNPPSGTRWFPDVVYDFAHHQLTPFIVTVLILIALVRLLMNYLLWDEMAEARGEDAIDDEPLISVKNLVNGHELDVVKLADTPDSHVISVGLDRRIRVWNLRYDFAGHVVSRPRSPLESPFPVLAMAVDDDSNWLALLSTDQVLLWSITEQRWGPSMPVELHAQRPEAFFFGPTRRKTLRSIIVVRHNGTLVELWPDIPDSVEHVVCKSPIACAVAITEKATAIHPQPRTSIVTLSRRAYIHHVAHRDGIWVSSEVKFDIKDNKEPHTLLPMQGFSSYLVGRSQSVDLVNLHTAKVIHSFQTEASQPRSVKFVYHGQRVGPQGRGTVSSLTLAYISEEDKDLVLQTYLPSENCDSICFSDPAAPAAGTSCTWTETRQVTRRIHNPGVWTPLRNGCVLGIRKKQDAAPRSPIQERLPAFAQSSLRRRARADSPPKHPKPDDTWEIWVITRLEREGDIETTPFIGQDDPAALIVSDLGPIVKVGSSSAAVGYGNVVKVIAVGHERFESAEEGHEAENIGLTSRRRRHPGPRPGAASSHRK
ncbi:Sterol regulatory element-binding protein cleavage-activating protein [Cytospora mali]|uniref:Sterol regulatory element-binding protein cleavage-activating protein n=1 Tax=Cytospora mali TaxID=578113 RepID=A0A194UYR7_CYTMA|nr:Sterol regulatory element-binding protein cleavage-activating protein [Valsa mali var. pyri (nom. inval.)]